MQFPPLQPAKLIRRYKRFLTDIELPDGDITTIHCANTGAMTGCGSPGDIIWYSDSKSKTRKYPLSWELTQLPNDDMVCINTHRSNQLVFEALQHKQIKELAMYDRILHEVKYGEENSRIDFLLKGENQPDCYVEVKSITLVKDGIGMFPDAVTTRGQKHVRELLGMKKQGHRAVVVFAGLHSGFDCFTTAADIDPEYDKLLRSAMLEGVEVLAYHGEFEFASQNLQNERTEKSVKTQNFSTALLPIGLSLTTSVPLKF